MVDPSLQLSSDGSHTLHSEAFGETYHSIHGAYTESLHVFINAGLLPAFDRFEGPIRILEFGFGTGLNAALAFDAAYKAQRQIQYLGLEAFPPSAQLISQLNYSQFAPCFHQISETPWNQVSEMGNEGSLEKQHTNFLNVQFPESSFHLIFFDAFAPKSHPEAWEEHFIQRTTQWLVPQGIWVTYSTTGALKQALRKAGCTVERLQGPPGKHHMTRAVLNPIVKES